MSDLGKDFEITHENRKNITIFKLKGTLVMNKVPNFDEYVNEHKEKPDIGLNFKELEFIDSSGIGSIVSLLSKLKATRGKLVCYNLNDDILSVFKMSKLTNFLEIMTRREFDRKYPRLGSSFQDIMKNKGN